MRKNIMVLIFMLLVSLLLLNCELSTISNTFRIKLNKITAQDMTLLSIRAQAQQGQAFFSIMNFRDIFAKTNTYTFKLYPPYDTPQTLNISYIIGGETTYYYEEIDSSQKNLDVILLQAHSSNDNSTPYYFVTCTLNISARDVELNPFSLLELSDQEKLEKLESLYQFKNIHYTRKKNNQINPDHIKNDTSIKYTGMSFIDDILVSAMGLEFEFTLASANDPIVYDLDIKKGDSKGLKRFEATSGTGGFACNTAKELVP